MTEERKSQVKYSPPNYTTVDRVATRRQARLLGCALIRVHTAEVRCPSCWSSVDVAEKFADAMLPLSELYQARDAIAHQSPNTAIEQMACTISRRVTEGSCPIGIIAQAAQISYVLNAEESQLQQSVIDDIFASPRALAFASEWGTDTVIALARAMYDSREFSAMPILADALQDAGCDNTEILTHCRDANQVHVRGCWVVDLVLGKA
jgi:hypothetical protein